MPCACAFRTLSVSSRISRYPAHTHRAWPGPESDGGREWDGTAAEERNWYWRTDGTVVGEGNLL